MVLDAYLLNTQYYKIWNKGKWSNPGKSVAHPLHLGVVAIEKGALRLPSTRAANFYYTIYIHLSFHLYIYIYVY